MEEGDEEGKREEDLEGEEVLYAALNPCRTSLPSSKPSGCQEDEEGAPGRARTTGKPGRRDPADASMHNLAIQPSESTSTATTGGPLSLFLVTCHEVSHMEPLAVAGLLGPTPASLNGAGTTSSGLLATPPLVGNHTVAEYLRRQQMALGAMPVGLLYTKARTTSW